MVGWFEIPVGDLERAKNFYDAVFDISILLHEFDEFKMGWFPNDPEKKGATGSLVQHEMYRPSTTDGPLVYFSCKDVNVELSRVVDAGGEVLRSKKEIGDGHGFMALIIDSEGNRIAMHSQV